MGILSLSFKPYLSLIPGVSEEQILLLRAAKEEEEELLMQEEVATSGHLLGIGAPLNEADLPLKV